jgi:hypothetical protein
VAGGWRHLRLPAGAQAQRRERRAPDKGQPLERTRPAEPRRGYPERHRAHPARRRRYPVQHRGRAVAHTERAVPHTERAVPHTERAVPHTERAVHKAPLGRGRRQQGGPEVRPAPVGPRGPLRRRPPG